MQNEGKDIERLREKIEELSEELRSFRSTLEGLIVLLAKTSILDDPIARLVSVLKATKPFPLQVCQILVKNVIEFAKEANMEFDSLADALVKGYCNDAKEIVPLEVISSNYGFKAAERWKEIVGGSSSNCEMRPKIMEKDRGL